MFNPWGLLLVVLGGVLLWEAWLGDPGHLWGAISGHPAAGQSGGNAPPAALGPQINVPGFMPPPGAMPNPGTPVQTN